MAQLFYHFANKEALCIAVLEAACRRIRAIEAGLHLDDLAPEDTLRKLVAFTFECQHDNEPIIRLVVNENTARDAVVVLQALAAPRRRGCSAKKRSISRDASGPSPSVKLPAASPPDQAWPAPCTTQCSARLGAGSRAAAVW